MPYIVLDDFRGGLDARREPVAAPAGTCVELRNAIVNRGGEIESRKSFVKVGTLPAGTHGLLGGSAAYVFGTADPPSGLPSGVQYRKLVGSSLAGSGIRRVLDATTFAGQQYVVAEFADGDVQHFYNGSLVEDWRGAGLRRNVTDNAGVAAALAVYTNARTKFRASYTAGDTFFRVWGSVGLNYSIEAQNGLSVTIEQNAIANAREVRASALISVLGASGQSPGVTSIVAPGNVELMAAPTQRTNNIASMPSLIAKRINQWTYRTGWYARISGTNGVRIYAASGHGASLNGQTLTVSYSDLNLTVSALSGGVDAVVGQAKICRVNVVGTFNAATRYWYIIGGFPVRCWPDKDGAYAHNVHAHSSKMYALGRNILYFSKLLDPTGWPYTGHNYTGAGFQNLTQVENSAGVIGVGLEAYGSQLAIFTQNSISIWAMDPDPSKNQRVQFIGNTGALAPRGIVAYGNQDIIYLSSSGIRSLRARDSSGIGAVEDLGSPVDDLVIAHMKTLSSEQIERTIAIVEPETGALWYIIGNKIFVFSYYPRARISAWSMFDLPFNVDHACVADNRLWLRSGNDLYIYGGYHGNIYPDEGEAPVIVQLPFMSANYPANIKQLTGFDAALVGEWHCMLLTDPNDSSAMVDCGIMSGVTYHGPHVIVECYATHFAPRLICTAGGRAKIANIAVHYRDMGAQ